MPRAGAVTTALADLLDLHNPTNYVGKFDLDLELPDGDRLSFVGLVRSFECLRDGVISCAQGWPLQRQACHIFSQQQEIVDLSG